MIKERKEPTVSSVLSSKDDFAGDPPPSKQTAEGQPVGYGSYSPSGSVRQKTSSVFVIFTFFITLLALAVGGYSFWQLQLSQQSLLEQQLRIVDLEKQLTISDDTANQSLTSVSVKVNELSQKATQANSEIDKLWAARNVNVDSIKKTGKRIDSSLKKAAKEYQQLETSLSQSAQRIAEQELLIQSLRERLGDQNKTLQSLSSKVKKNTTSTAGIRNFEGRIKEAEEALTSLEAFRRNVNRDILQLKAGAAAVKK